MNKAALIGAIAAKTNTSKAAAGRAVDALLEIVTQQVAQGDDVALLGFGTFKAAQRAARVGRNPRTGESVEIAATTVVTFKAGVDFKAAVAPRK